MGRAANRQAAAGASCGLPRELSHLCCGCNTRPQLRRGHAGAHARAPQATRTIEMPLACGVRQEGAQRSTPAYARDPRMGRCAACEPYFVPQPHRQACAQRACAWPSVRYRISASLGPARPPERELMNAISGASGSSGARNFLVAVSSAGGILARGRAPGAQASRTRRALTRRAPAGRQAPCAWPPVHLRCLLRQVASRTAAHTSEQPTLPGSHL